MNASPAKTSVRSHRRPEIQALRAIAVLAVVLYHLWPERLPGGYAGVDVFFAISGFLIIGQLIRQTDQHGRLQLLQFWAARARRLLPASLLVLAATGIAIVLLVPAVAWMQFFKEIGASALYFENWLLAADSVDYLASHYSASPVQHFWSLSVEEQFYVAWPLLIVLLLLVSRAMPPLTRRRIILGGLVIVTAASFVWSVIDVANEPSVAYFATTGRAWEFGVGGIVAYFAAQPLQARHRMRAAASWVGLVAIAVTVFLYTGDTPFPGAAALLPVGGTLLVIWAGVPNAKWSPTRLLALRPVQWLGDISYSLYLWHWAPIVILPLVLGYEVGWRAKVVILVAAIVLAALTKKFVEDPIRLSRPLLSRPAWVSLTAMLAGTAIIVAASGGAYLHVRQDVDRANAATAAALAKATQCLGAAAVAPGSTCSRPYAANQFTNPAFAGQDIGKGVQVVDQCKQGLEDSTVMTCEVGDTKNASRTIAVMGDSHAGHFLEALDIYGKANKILFVSYLKTWCAGTGADGVSSAQDNSALGIESCAVWGRHAISTIAADPRITAVMFANFTEEYTVGSKNGLGRTVTAADFETAWQPLLAAGKTVVVERDIPNARPTKQDVPTCISAHLTEYDPCTSPRGEAIMDSARDPLLQAAAATPAVRTMNLDDVFCDPTTCHTLIGGLIVYFGDNHMTATFSRTLAPILGQKLTAALSAAG